MRRRRRIRIGGGGGGGGELDGGVRRGRGRAVGREGEAGPGLVEEQAARGVGHGDAHVMRRAAAGGCGAERAGVEGAGGGQAGADVAVVDEGRGEEGGVRFGGGREAGDVGSERDVGDPAVGGWGSVGIGWILRADG